MNATTTADLAIDADELAQYMAEADLDATDNDSDTMVCADIAAELGMTGRALRRRFRSLGLGCGQGSFYVINRAELPALRARLGL